MNCPLCASELRKHLLSPSQAILSCPNEACAYPFNLPMDEVRRQGLTLRTSELEIMAQMGDKLARAQVDPRTARFMTKSDGDTQP
ncbi:hypothetical protein METBIDRAFT_31497 [Metschnikowia bicuspidata var. bicuspidata NRRL YB-4993]|uniref:Uncharacterized protein n=1 Tax=Metschnikowia bicuspidata var. bicuspidata NRRL YB-4993 TaxID=869754 RepID=A0A1A0HES3_9ASCO|nr:hypothetical protein METBIDRAFT_31497 [Metschnikowia bicuspidata var. bicuspidata NRRL YB-4993]OBA22624.1 hypothetical protein METBIDRAFT_31497 [Metschnikowia bicuspidata var. bicuspidata NRRL YB-4993]